MNRQFLLDMLPKKSIGVEIGVAKGNFSSEILKTVRPKRLYLVDPWHFDAEAHKIHRWYGGYGNCQANFDKVHDSVVKRFKDCKNVEIRRKPSAQFLVETVPDYFDWVYIDGDHTFGPCITDILLSISKVKLGGFICGDDYDWAPQLQCPVSKAVIAVRAYEKRLQLLDVKNGQWIFKRVK